MIEAGKEEKRLAEERGSYHDGVLLFVLLLMEGHSYNANSGVGIILGEATGKLLHIGVQNKFCTSCSRNIPKEAHDCYKNWNAIASEMEVDIIVEGFIKTE